ncbi:family 16 glycosylhydrolase [Marinomonas sp. MED121]|uniref:family 16 glycosylhydrolase n=1 Tax=Marinomonas sp. MED121 TaxID=314277 RepID=UPI00030708A0|nr:family 16 glycosylhydrolase [Marinomonas sp. MED121]
MFKNNKNITPLLAGLPYFALCMSSVALAGTDYQDAYWSTPEVNSDFYDQFDEDSLDRSKWKVEDEIYVNGEDIDYQDVEYPASDWTIASGQADTDASDGKSLILKARYMDGEIQNYYGDENGKPLFIRSGRIESQITNDTTFTYGKFEARIKVPPSRNGEFPAWWLLGNYDDVGWTACQELDIMEFTGNVPTGVPQTHWTAPYTSYGSFRADYADVDVTDPENNYVTYGVIKTPDSVEWYVNGILTKTFSRDNQADDQPWPYVTPMRMILNHAITHTDWDEVGNYNLYSQDPDVENATGYSYSDDAGVTWYEYIDVASMDANIGREGTDFIIDYVAHWPLPETDDSFQYVDDSKYSFFRDSGNTTGFYNLKGWLAPIAVTGDDYLDYGGDDDFRDNGIDNAADGYVGSKWATPNDDNQHWVQMDYGEDKAIDYLWLEWGWNLPSQYDIYAKKSNGNWQLLESSSNSSANWATHTFDVNDTYRYFKLVTKGRIDKSNPIWLLEFKAFEEVANAYPQPASINQLDERINMLSNGAFDANTSGWGQEFYDGADYSLEAINGELAVIMNQEGANSGSAQTHTSGFSLEQNYTYHLSFNARTDGARDLIVRLANNFVNPTQTYLEETISLSAGMQTYSFDIDFSNDSSTGRLAFLFGDMGTTDFYIDDVVLRKGDYFGEGDVLVEAIGPASYVSESQGWETDWWGVASRAVDGSIDTKASGQDGESEDQILSVSVEIDAFYEVKALKVAGDNSSDRSLDQFRAEYGNGSVLMDWTTSNTDGEYETFENFVSQPAYGEQNFTFFFSPPAGELVEVADVQLMAVDYMPHRIYSLSMETDYGSVSPAGIERYSKEGYQDPVYHFIPNAGYQVSDVLIDGVSVGAVTRYQFHDVTQDHTVTVSFKAE